MTLPVVERFVEREIPTPDKMNELIDTLVAQFNGSISSNSLAWPFLARGDIDMRGNAIYGFTAVNNVQYVNDDLSLADAITNASSDGNIIAITPGYTATAEDLDVVDDNITIIGYGPERPCRSSPDDTGQVSGPLPLPIISEGRVSSG